MVVNKIRSNILTEESIHALVKVVESEIGGVTREQRNRLQTIDSEAWRRAPEAGQALQPGGDHRHGGG